MHLDRGRPACPALPPWGRGVRGQLAFLELLEVAQTRDRTIDYQDGGWGTRLAPPTGDGWRVRDASRERHTTWERRRLVTRPTVRVKGQLP